MQRQIQDFVVSIGDTTLAVFSVDIKIPATPKMCELISGDFKCVKITYLDDPSSLLLQLAPKEEFFFCPHMPGGYTSNSDDEGCIDDGWRPNPYFHQNETDYLYIRPGLVGLFSLPLTETIKAFDGHTLKTNRRTAIFSWSGTAINPSEKTYKFVFSDLERIILRPYGFFNNI